MELSPLTVMLLLTGFFHSTQTQHVSDQPKPTVSVNPQSFIYTGDTVTLTCEMKPSTGWKFIWYRKGQDTLITEAEDSSTLSIKASNAESRIYCCIAYRGNYNSQYSDGVTITVRGRPKATVKVTPADHVFTGEKVTLTCQIVAAGSWQYEWYRSNEKLRGVNVQKNEFIISSISESDEGDYRCKGTQSTRPTSSEISAAVRLTVSERPKPTVKVTPTDDIFTGENLTFTCQIEAAGSWQYHWYRNNENLSGDNVQNNYTISNISESDEGNYTCKGTQSTRPTSSEISAAVRLTVSDLNGRVTIRSFTDSNKAQYFCRAGSGDPIYHTSYRDAFRGNGAVSVSGSVGAGGFVGIAVGLSLTLFFTIVLILLWFYKRNKGSGSGQNSNQDAGGDQVYESPDDFETADSTSDQGMKRGNKQD